MLFVLVLAMVAVAFFRLTEFLFPEFLEGSVKWLVTAVLALAVIWACLRLHDGEAIDWRSAYGSGTRVGNFLITQFLYSLIVMGGLILLVIPGIIWAVQFGMAGYVSLDEGLDPIEALKRSSRLTRGTRGELVLLGLLLTGINLLGFLALGIGLFATIPLTWMAWTRAYRLLQQETLPVATATA